jgi:transcriptional regulator with XRE-family HTH domain
MTNIRKILGLNIKTYRCNLGFSQEKLAEIADIATNYLGLIERGKKFPSAEMIERIAYALGKDSLDLFIITPNQQDWGKKLLTKIAVLIDEEIKILNSPSVP